MTLVLLLCFLHEQEQEKSSEIRAGSRSISIEELRTSFLKRYLNNVNSINSCGLIVIDLQLC